jgi:hypothetical protein
MWASRWGYHVMTTRRTLVITGFAAGVTVFALRTSQTGFTIGLPGYSLSERHCLSYERKGQATAFVNRTPRPHLLACRTAAGVHRTINAAADLATGLEARTPISAELGSCFPSIPRDPLPDRACERPLLTHEHPLASAGGVSGRSGARRRLNGAR